jgi:uncharacterized protein YodC (DUF2158 family)
VSKPLDGTERPFGQLVASVMNRYKIRHGIQVGDKVKLRGGGRVMIVSLVVGDPPPWPWPSPGRVECQWFIQDDLQTAVLDPATLDRVE